LAEGATGSYFDLFVLIANPTTRSAGLLVTYYLPDGTNLQRTLQVAPQSRFTIWVDEEEFPGRGKALRDTAVSIGVQSRDGVPIVVERSMWWPGPTAATWQEAHASAGSVTTAARWGAAAGEEGGVRGAETYLLIANVSDRAARVRVTMLREGGATELRRDYEVAAGSRFNVSIASEFPDLTGQRFSALVEGSPGSRLVVETAIYERNGGIGWSAGGNAVATPLTP